MKVFELLENKHHAHHSHGHHWTDKVKIKKHPPKGLFSEGSAREIANWLKKTHKTIKSAMSALNFYVNRAGKHLSHERKKVMERVKEILEQ